MRVGGSAVLVAAAWCAAAADVAAGDEPRGPAFGTNRYRTALVRAGNEPDSDDFVAPLARGETLSVRVVAARGADLAPRIRLVAPSGAMVDPGARPRRGGREALLDAFEVAETGPWTVRVDGGEGAYTVSFRVRAQPALRLRKRPLGGDAPGEEAFSFEAVAGSRLTLRLDADPGGAGVGVAALVGPTGEAIALPPPRVGRGGRRLVFDVPLGAAHGEHKVVVGSAEDPARYSMRLTVAPPPRPRGAADLSPDEPRLAPLLVPVTATAGSVVRLHGAHFAATLPRSRVFFGSAEATVVGAGSLGTTLDVVAPPAAEGSVVPVTVQNPDGQAVTRPGYVLFVPDVPLDVAALDPAEVALAQGARRRFTVSLTRPAPPLGLEIALAATGGVGEVPGTVIVAGGTSKADFELAASPSPASGSVVATATSSVSAAVEVLPPARLRAIEPAATEVLENSTTTFVVLLDAPAPPAGIDVELAADAGVGTVPAWVRIPGGATSAPFALKAGPLRAEGALVARSANSVAAAVRVVPPTTIDLSGWRIEQANSSRTFTIPAGSVLSEGGYLVIGRSAAKNLFSTYWGRTLGANVVYVDGLDLWPNVNGSETYTLKDRSGVAVDGPTIAMPSGGGYTIQRAPGLPAGNAASWTTAASSPVSNATPGSGQSAAPVPAGVYVSEFSDADGSGNFVYEFVELHFDRHP